MTEQTLTISIDLNAPLETVFEFFMNAENLQRLTPPWVKFEILSQTPIQMEVGSLIDYRIRVRGVWMKWRTKITLWEPNVCFIDEQLSGPYRQWIHEHRFEPIDGGIRMTDTVRYILPMGWLGALALPLVRRDVAAIFRFRSKTMTEFFGPMPSST